LQTNPPMGPRPTGARSFPPPSSPAPGILRLGPSTALSSLRQGRPPIPSTIPLSPEKPGPPPSIPRARHLSRTPGRRPARTAPFAIRRMGGRPIVELIRPDPIGQASGERGRSERMNGKGRPEGSDEPVRWPVMKLAALALGQGHVEAVRRRRFPGLHIAIWMARSISGTRREEMRRVPS